MYYSEANQDVAHLRKERINSPKSIGELIAESELFKNQFANVIHFKVNYHHLQKVLEAKQSIKNQNQL